MNQNLLYKWLFIAGVVLACILGVIGFPKNVKELHDNIASRIRLGLDLQGGTHLILEVQVDDAVNAETDQAAGRLRELMKKKNIAYDDCSRSGLGQMLVKGIAVDKIHDFEDLLTGGTFDNSWGKARAAQDANATANTVAYALKLPNSVINTIRKDAVTQSLVTIRRRIDDLGLTEPDIREHGRGENEILVQLPGVDDPVHVKSIIQDTAMLSIQPVVDPNPYSSPEAAMAAKGGVLPEGSVIYKEVGSDTSSGDSAGERWYVLSKTSVVTGRDLRSARVGADENGRPDVGFTLKADGGQRFGVYTEQNVNNYMAVVLDNKIYTVAQIQSKITDSGRIIGRFSQQHAQDLALVLRSGALPATVKFNEERTVGPSLGADSIHSGVVAAGAGLIFVMVFMMVYYKLSGLNAIISLVLNLLILMASLAYFGATLTLPGIAGIILTIGMAVDSNVLVFERIREELRNGKAVVASMKAGFEKAFATIVDTHVTTVVSCFFLFLFGTGPIRGFAVTLVVGLIANVFTAVFVSRAIFEFEFSRRREAAISI
jgi:preprotein translocase subunit SecD